MRLAVAFPVNRREYAKVNLEFGQNRR